MSHLISLPVLQPRKVSRAPPPPPPTSWWGRANNFLKQHKLISRGLDSFGHPKLASLARVYGFGRKRRPRRAGGARAKPVKF